MSRLDTHTLACLDALVTEAHVSRAAYRMGMSQPAMSSMLSRLRTIFRDPLLVRTSRGMAATPRAVEVAEKARQVLRLLDQAVSGGGESAGQEARLEVRIRILNSLASYFMPKLVHCLQNEAPRLRIWIQQADVRRALDLLESDECDIAVGIPPAVSPTLHASRLFPLKLRCIVRKNHPEISTGITLAQFAKYPHVVLNGGPVPVSTIEVGIDQELRAHRLARQVGVSVPDLLLSPEIVAQTDFIATVPERIVRQFAGRLDLRVLEPPLTLGERDILMMWHERTHRDPMCRRVRQIIRRLAKQVNDLHGPRVQ